MQCYISPNLFWWRNKLIHIKDGLRVSTFFSKYKFLEDNYCFKHVAMVFQVVSYWLKPKEPTSKSQFPLSRLWDVFGRIIFHQAAVFITKPPVSSKAAQLVVSFTCSTDDAGRRKRQSLINYKFCSGFFFTSNFFVWALVIVMTALANTAKQLTMKYSVFWQWTPRRNWNYRDCMPSEPGPNEEKSS